MNSTQLASRLVFMAKQLRGEADRWPGIRGDHLKRGARQLTYAFPKAYSKDPDQRAEAEALLEGAIEFLVATITARTNHALTKGNTQ
jgi:hypothetical protein